MIPKKRAYVPRVRGCHECSSRRINCDKTQPRCIKCKTKGIFCSGYGFRFKIITHGQQSKRHLPRPLQIRELPSNAGTESEPYNILGNVEIRSNPSYQHTLSLYTKSDHTSFDTTESLEEARPSVAQNTTQGENDGSASLSYILFNPVISQNECSLLYFSEKIAPILVLIDDQHNGWRRLVLPLAHCDDLIMDAVISAAAFGLSAGIRAQATNPNIAYQAVIRKLRARQDPYAQSDLEKQCVMLALLLLLADNIVNGLSDFRAILRLIEAFRNAVKNDEIFTRGELGNFLSTQIEKFRGFASPFMSQEEAMKKLCQTTPVRPPVSKGWTEFLTFCDTYPQLNSFMSVIYEANQKACNIYLMRLSAGPDSPTLTNQVDDFVETLNELPANSPGEYSLIWPVYLVALESSTDEHRKFFTEFLLRQHRYSGFANIIKAVECLESQWEVEHHNWTHWLTDLTVFVV